jgi:hypothetical protein
VAFALFTLLLFLSPAEGSSFTTSSGGQSNRDPHAATQGLTAVGSPHPPGPPCLTPSSAYSTAVIQASSTEEPIPGSTLPSVRSGAALSIGSLQSSETISLELVFSIRNRQQFEACLASIETPGSPNYRHFLNESTLAPYMPTPGEKASVVSYLTHEGFRVSDGASPLVIGLKGTAETVESTFGVRLGLFEQDSTRFYATESDPRLPQNFAAMTEGITGLDNYTVAKPAETPCGYGGAPDCPQGTQVGYNMNSLYSGGYNGSGVTVAVNMGYGDPNPQNAIDTFDSQYGLPNVTLRILFPEGKPASFDPDTADEAAMDIEAVHAMAPGAGITLVYNLNGMDALDYIATDHIASIASNSWGYIAAETQLSSTLLSTDDSRLMVDAAQGLTMVFSSGDKGAYPDGILSLEFPASDPNVLSVGATNLNLTGCTGVSCTGYGSEDGAEISGGGFSSYFPEPSWQISAIGSKPGRGVPDVSMLGYAPNFWVYSTNSTECGSVSVPTAGWFGCAGTSLSTPLWAGFLAVAFQHAGEGSFGNIDPVIYSLGSGSSYSSIFHDVTAGNNGNSTAPGYSAAPGWDPVTGWGSPIGDQLARAMATAFGGPTLATTTPLIDSGQSASFTLSWFGGAPPFIAKLYYGSDPSCSIPGKQLDQRTGISGSPQSFVEPTLAVGMDYICGAVTDSSNPPKVAATTFAATVTVNPALAAPTISANPRAINTGQSSTLVTTVSFGGGTPSYTCQWLKKSPAATSFTALGSSFTTGCTSSSKPSKSTGALTTLGTWSFELQVRDTAGKTVVSLPVGLTVTKASTKTTISCTKPSFGKGKSTTCTAAVSGSYSTHTGTITWTKVSGKGGVTFSSKICTLKAGKCSVTITGAVKGSITIKATYGGDSNNPQSSGTKVLTVT